MSIMAFNNIQVSTLDICEMYSYIHDYKSGVVHDYDGRITDMEDMYNEISEKQPEITLEPTFEEHLDMMLKTLIAIIEKRRSN